MDIVNYILGNRYKGSGGYDKTTTLSWDGVLTDDEKTFGPYDSDGKQFYFYKISDEPLSSDAFRNSITTFEFTKTGEIRSSDAAKNDCIIGVDDEVLIDHCTMTLNVFIEKDPFKRGLFISKAINKSDDNDAIYVKSISYKTPIPLQNKFIPLAEDGVKGGIVGTAKTDDMLTPVGIDENGKLFAESQFYDTRDTKDLVMTFDGNLDGKEYIETEPGTYFVKYSDYVPPYDSVNYINGTFASNGSEQTGNVTKDNLFYMSDDNLIAYGINGGALNFIYSGSMTIGDKTMTQGAWVAYIKSDDVTNIYKEITINYNVGELKQIDKKYIPEQKPLTFTGAVTGSYDGSEPLTVEIPSGADGSPGKDGADGKSAYQYAVEGGYTGTEAEFAAKLAEEMPDTLPNPNALTFSGAVSATYDGSAPCSVDIPIGGGDGVMTYYNMDITKLASGTIPSGTEPSVTNTGITFGQLNGYRRIRITISNLTSIPATEWAITQGTDTTTWKRIGLTNNRGFLELVKVADHCWEARSLSDKNVSADGWGDSPYNSYLIIKTGTVLIGSILNFSTSQDSEICIYNISKTAADINWAIQGLN